MAVCALAVGAAGFAAETGVAPSAEDAYKPAAGLASVVFATDDGAWSVPRDAAAMARSVNGDMASTSTRARVKVQAIVEGPTPQEKAGGISAALPVGTSLVSMDLSEDNALQVVLQLPEGFVRSANFGPSVVENTARQFHGTFMNDRLSAIELSLQDGPNGETRPIRDWLPAPPVFERESDNALTDGTPPAPKPDPNAPRTNAVSPTANPGPITGVLSGKTVILNQAHGWFQDGSWKVQRTLLYEQIEDLAPAEFITNFVIPMLQNAGAEIQTVRESDSQTQMVIVDNAQSAPTYVESGSWSNSSANGFVNKAGATWNGVDVNPFGSASATRYTTSVIGSPTATTTYAPTIPVDGYYNVYISYSSGSNRTTSAHWQVHHAGGVTDFRVNEQRNGATWNLLGNFYFKAGQSANAKVLVLNDAPTVGAIVSCDAVRFGGGMGDVVRRTSVSGKERWQEEALNYMNYLGASVSGGPLANDDTVTYNDMQLGWSNRPAYASWEQARDGEGDNTIYVGLHTNAFNGTCVSGVEQAGTARGMGTFRDVDADATAGSIALTSALHTASINGIKKFYDSTWSDRGITASNSYGECSQGNLGSVAGCFFEAMMADNPADQYSWRDPKFRVVYARAIQQGIITYFGGTVFPPEAPEKFRIKNIGSGQVRLDWTAGPVRTAALPYGSAATSYRVYRSANGYGFDNGTVVASNTATVTVTPGEVAFFRVVAANSSGVSIPTETLGVGATSAAQAPALIVNGSHRFDMNLPKLVSTSGSCSSGKVRKIDPRTFQSFNYIIQHGLALGATGTGFDSCTDACIESSIVSLTAYNMVDWIGAQEAESTTELMNTDDTAIKPTSRTALGLYLKNGGRVFMSNAELAWDFGRSGVAADKTAFLNSYMKAAYSADDANTFAAVPAAGGIFAGLSSLTFDNGTGPTYEVRFPDVLTAFGGSTAALNYSGGTGGIAAVQYAGTFDSGSATGKVVMMGFGFETILSSSIRAQMMQRIVDYFAPAPPPAGSLTVTIQPAAAVSAGAQWRRVDTSPWFNSGATETGITPLPYNVEFKPIAGWTAPGYAAVTIYDGQTATAGGTYVQNTGSLVVTIIPGEVVTAGGQWRLDGGAWQDSGSALTDVLAGSHTVSFKPVVNYTTPDDITANVLAGQTSVLLGTYVSSVDYVLESADFNPGSSTPVQPGGILDVTWSVSGSSPATVWAELFLSKTGGFDSWRGGATLTNSSQWEFPGGTEDHTPGNQVVNYVPDGSYTIIPMFNRAGTGGPTESNYINNWAPIAGKRILIRNNQAATSDLAWSGNPTFTVNGQNVSVSGTLINLSGNTPVYGFWVETMYGTFTDEGLFLQEGFISGGTKYSVSLGPNETAFFNQSGIAPAGKDLVVVVDSTDIISETEERNNSASYRVSTPVGRGTLDLTVTDAAFSAAQLAPAEQSPSGMLQWSVTIRNNSTQPTGEFWVELFHSNNGGIGTMKSGITLTQSERVSLAASETKTFNLNQPFNQITDGIYSAVAVVNRNSVGINPGDTNPSDNSLTLPGRVVLINSTEPQANLVWNSTPVVTRTGNAISITGRVTNIGTAATGGASWVEAFYGTMDVAGRYFPDNVVAGGVLVTALASGAGQDITINGVVPNGSWVVGVITDSTDLVPETNETDNYTYHPE